MYEKFMKRAIEIAKKGLGRVNPNPPVGAIIVKNGKIISEGFHPYFGGPHAERVAIERAKKKEMDLAGATLIVTLEPCDHHGKTPPCTDLIIESGIKEVVVGMRDPNPVSGKGIEKLKKHGIKVIEGVLENEVKKLCEFFITSVTKKRPFIAIKYASTLDGKIADANGKSKWITHRLRPRVHKLRNFYSAVLVGAGTVLKDNPRLTCRTKNGRNPIRVVLDRKGILSEKNFKVFEKNARVIVFTQNERAKYPEHVEKVITDCSVETILKTLHEKGVDSLLVEGGSDVFSEFLKYADVIYAFYSTKIFGKGLDVFSNVQFSVEEPPRFEIARVKTSDTEIFMELRPCSQE
ncbi:bifunctional diaminohydroxyphosphoribosylaminopyrimidine deaminase/5-amino-6-(5-phosphoribosylamino)uracil reductase RibD [Thermotoga sp.]|uniref:bifunctional diaminohydroxyphosphoribosylaminopyrimidine deaminase/5-amino-6-(5-phosphoribosylamino)uracil reductase RibD n=1 Tax=Thermotoga sp. TaxID=28240 RepID=UPI0025D230FA|nr:bifunctional diaminohydroxyphosphoribosylaminopyrimidine deaminase/5-amino-6-(5-phosphoribosylamino)uracil reductase RibD [Thermotoga sp.]MCD6551433.1 bifunctional diaminohydroxyphosphoribosylaminopyrimidine deaminase/5-amino-6-(5-phosphoribosylamino)uracil reductase RibD [Thermotoga sp.]